MKQILIAKGDAVVADVPAPVVEQGTVLVRVAHSCMSPGTELSGVRASGKPLWRRALDRPAAVKKVALQATKQGVSAAWRAVDAQVNTPAPIGYSVAGTVLEVGEGVTKFAVGDLVACAGAQAAYHAEVVCVPENLTVLVPSAVGSREACTVALGAIALQGVRRAQPTLGETFVVVGLGILGQLTEQLLRANGCRTIGIDLNVDRVRIAEGFGLHVGLVADATYDINSVARLTDGVGADGVIITAGTPSNQPISLAFQMCRKKGRVVIVGDVGLALDRADFYHKEIDVFISSSYGPGRYDRRYEEEGLDYPVAFVRWTENRNMGEYLRLVASQSVNTASLITSVVSVDDAPGVYEQLQRGEGNGLLTVLSFPNATTNVTATDRLVRTGVPTGESTVPRVALIGAGAFAKAMHLPLLESLAGELRLHAVVSRAGHNATAAATRFHAEYATTDVDAVLSDDRVDAVIIATRHDLHAGLALRALRAGKHVLVEKPLAITADQLGEIKAYFAENERCPVLLTGFNRRFSPYGVRMRELVARRAAPMMISYRMNAGYLPPDHWVHGAEGGGRNIGEACHIYDLFTALTDAPLDGIDARAITQAGGYYVSSDNFVATARFGDGSVASLTYTALGAPGYPKETAEVYVDGTVIHLQDYQELSVTGTSASGLRTRVQSKGQREELLAFARAIRSGEWPIPLWQQLQVAEMAFEVEVQLGCR